MPSFRVSNKMRPFREVSRLVARVRPVTLTDWLGKAGERLRSILHLMSDFAAEHDVAPREIASQGVELGRRKLEGLANHEFSEATKNFADAEKAKMEAALQRRSLESDVRKKDAESRKAAAEARTAEINTVSAEIDLLRKLQDAGVVLRMDGDGNLTVLPSLPGRNLLQLAEQRRLDSGLTDLVPNTEDDTAGIREQKQRLSVARRAGARLEEANALIDLGDAYFSVGRLRSGAECYQQTIPILQEIGEVDDEANVHFTLSIVLDQVGERAGAVEHAQVALEIYVRSGNPNATKVKAKLEAWGRES